MAPGAVEPAIPRFNPLTGVPYTPPAGLFGYEPAAGAGAFTATANWGDGAATPATVTSGKTCAYEVTTSSHTYADPGTYMFSYTVHNTHTGLNDTVSEEQFFVWSVPWPVPDASPRSVQATAGVPWNGVVGEFAYDSTRVPTSKYIAQIEWGDRALSSGAIAARPNGVFAVSGTHTYSQPTDGTVKVTLFGVVGPELGAWATAHMLVSPPASPTQGPMATPGGGTRLRFVGQPIAAAIPSIRGSTSYEIIFRLDRQLPRTKSGRIRARLTSYGVGSAIASFGSHRGRKCYAAGSDGLAKRSPKTGRRYPFTLDIQGSKVKEIGGRAVLRRYFNFVSMLSGANRQLGC